MANGKAWINYTSGSLARGKAKAKKKRSSSHDDQILSKRKRSAALFPPKTQIEPTPSADQNTSLRRDASAVNQADADDGGEPNRRQKPERTERAFLLDSDLAIARRAGKSPLNLHDHPSPWWVDLRGENKAAAQFEKQVETKIKTAKQDADTSTGVNQEGRSIWALLQRPDFLAIPSQSK